MFLAKKTYFSETVLYSFECVYSEPVMESFAHFLYAGHLLMKATKNVNIWVNKLVFHLILQDAAEVL